MYLANVMKGGLASGSVLAGVLEHGRNMCLQNIRGVFGVAADVNTVRIEDLSSDQIEAARARRSKER
jgi:hypothetical protein